MTKLEKQVTIAVSCGFRWKARCTAGVAQSGCVWLFHPNTHASSPAHNGLRTFGHIIFSNSETFEECEAPPNLNQLTNGVSGDGLLPDYLGNRDSIHDAIARLSQVKTRVWFSHLSQICGNPVEACKATAEQLADAYLMTIGRLPAAT